MSKTAKTGKEEGGSKFHPYNTPRGSIVRELNEPIGTFTGDDIHTGMAVVAKDEKGEYVTTTYFAGTNMADPFKLRRIKPPPIPVVEEVKIEPETEKPKEEVCLTETASG